MGSPVRTHMSAAGCAPALRLSRCLPEWHRYLPYGCYSLNMHYVTDQRASATYLDHTGSGVDL